MEGSQKNPLATRLAFVGCSYKIECLRRLTLYCLNAWHPTKKIRLLTPLPIKTQRTHLIKVCLLFNKFKTRHIWENNREHRSHVLLLGDRLHSRWYHQRANLRAGVKQCWSVVQDARRDNGASSRLRVACWLSVDLIWITYKIRLAK